MVYLTHSLEWLGECCRTVSLAVLLLLSLTPVYLSAETNIPVLTTDTQLVTAGYYQLSWQPGLVGASNKVTGFELQRSATKSFRLIKTIYRGPDRASVISGRPDGVYYYRVRAIYSDQTISGWSKPVQVRVQHHSLQKAWLFFTAGALVFVITLLFIVVSSYRKDGE